MNMKKNENRRNEWIRPALGDLKSEPQVISRPLANQGSSIHVTYNLDFNQAVQRHQNTLGVTNYVCSFLDSSKHEDVEVL